MHHNGMSYPKLKPYLSLILILFPVPHLILLDGYFSLVSPQNGGRDSSVGIATRYWLDGPWIESRWEQDFPHPSRPALGSTQPPVQWVPGLSRR